MQSSTTLDWYKPEWWSERGARTGRDGFDVLAIAYALRAVDAAAVLEFMQQWHLGETDLPDRAFAAFPLTAGDVEPFLASANQLRSAEMAAIEITSRLMTLAGAMNEVIVALNILDVWRRRHDLLGDRHPHGDRCACLMNCDHTPQGIRALDESAQTYYEQHHELSWPECFGTNDELFRLRIAALVRNCLAPSAAV